MDEEAKKLFDSMFEQRRKLRLLRNELNGRLEGAAATKFFDRERSPKKSATIVARKRN